MAIRLLQSLFGHSFNTIVKDLSYDIERRLVEKGLASYSLQNGILQKNKTLPEGLSAFEQNLLSQKEAFDISDSEFNLMSKVNSATGEFYLSSDQAWQALIRARNSARRISASRIWSPSPYPAGTNNVTIANQIPVPEGGVTGFKLVYENGTTAASVLTTSKVAATTTDGDNGAALAWASATFAGSASAALPVAIGTTPQAVISSVISDHVSLPIQSGYLQVRSYFSGSGCALNPTLGELAAFATATGKIFKTGFSAGVVADNAGITLTSGQLITPSGVIWTHDGPAVTLACVGGSTLRGQGSTANATGVVYQAAAFLTTSAFKVSPYVAAVSGQNSQTSMKQLVELANSVNPQFLLFLGGSGNDSDLTVSGFSAIRGRIVENLEYCFQKRIVPILGTNPPSSSLNSQQNALRISNNQWMKSLVSSGVLVADIASVVEDATDNSKISQAYDSGDGIHLNNAGAYAAALVVADAVKLAF